MNPRQVEALTSPLGNDPVTLMRRRVITRAGDGALITTILAVDR
jgi:hypothetical protein